MFISRIIVTSKFDILSHRMFSRIESPTFDNLCKVRHWSSDDTLCWTSTAVLSTPCTLNCLERQFRISAKKSLVKQERHRHWRHRVENASNFNVSLSGCDYSTDMSMVLVSEQFRKSATRQIDSVDVFEFCSVGYTMMSDFWSKSSGLVVLPEVSFAWESLVFSPRMWLTYAFTGSLCTCHTRNRLECTPRDISRISSRTYLAAPLCTGLWCVGRRPWWNRHVDELFFAHGRGYTGSVNTSSPLLSLIRRCSHFNDEIIRKTFIWFSYVHMTLAWSHCNHIGGFVSSTWWSCRFFIC